MMRHQLRSTIVIILTLTIGNAFARDSSNRVLLVTHAGGFMHDSLLTAERVLKSLEPEHGLQVTCWRFTADPDARIKVKRKQGDQETELETTAIEDYSFRFQKMMGEPVTRQECGRINAETLKKFDAVLFFTTSTWTKERGSHPLTESELNDLIAWVKNGGGFIATHCGSDTLHNTTYGELVGATFGGHPWVQKVRLRAEDPRHPAAKGLTDGSEIFDEIYQFGAIPNHPAAVPLKVQPFSRDKLHIILSVDNRSFDVTKGSREDQDYPVAWCQRFGQGRSFYTSLGHHKEIWTDPRFQQHLLGGLKWALGQAEGDATPSGQLKPTAKNERVLFDFEESTDLDGWGNLELSKAKSQEPAAKIERVTENATAGDHCLKITFHGGTWPTVITRNVPDNWMAWETFKADVIVSRPCVVGFCVMQEGSSREAGWDGGVSRWAKTEFLKPGKNTISAGLHPNEWSAVRTKLENGKVLGKVISLEIFLYRPNDGEAIFVDNIRVSAAKEPPSQPSTTQFQVLGTDLAVSGVQELGKKLADQWTPPEPQTVEQVESRFRSLYEKLKQEHPRAVLAVLRDGEKGYDPINPDKIYSGWRDAYWSSHGPDGLTVDRSTNFGQSETQEIFMRHRSPLLRVDLSSIPRGSNIFAARLLIARAAELEKERSPLMPNMWVAEACNRPWTEREVDAYRYADGKYWKAIGGMFWQGDDPDFWPIYLAHGPSQPGCSHWDFTHAVRFWTDGKHANHGFMLHGDSKDWFRAWYREAPKLKDRPAVIVIYEPK